MEQSFILLPLPQDPLQKNPALSLSKPELGVELRAYHPIQNPTRQLWMLEVHKRQHSLGRAASQSHELLHCTCGFAGVLQVLGEKPHHAPKSPMLYLVWLWKGHTEGVLGSKPCRYEL